MKFLIPFSLLVSTGARVQMPPDTPSLHAVTVQQISMAFAPTPVFPAHERFHWEWIAVAIWAAGALFLMVRWFRNWRETKTAVLEPGVFGIFHPVLVLPEGISDRLTEEQLQAVLAHEARHIECYDNLTAALHMVVETLFWFHPLVWWIGARLMDERERDCDEAVLRQGSRPGVYARGIVQVCESYVESPLACASGISGSDLKKRIREIMTWRGSLPVTLRAKAMLAVAALAAVSIPFVIGILRAQTLPPPPAYGYDVASIHRSAPRSDNGWTWEAGPQGGLKTTHTTVLGLLKLAYQVQDYQIIGAPGWTSSERYDITLTPTTPDIAELQTFNATEAARRNRNWQRLQAVLRDRFGLVLRAETHELPVYALLQARNGVRLSRADGKGSSFRVSGPGNLTATAQLIGRLATFLSGELGRPVNDETGLDGQYDFKLEWTPDSDTSGTGPSIFTALTDQLGLRLESKKGPVQVYVIEKVERPSEN